MKRLSLWLKRAVLGLMALLLFHQLWLFGWVLWWKYVNPDTTRFMTSGWPNCVKSTRKPNWRSAGSPTTRFRFT